MGLLVMKNETIGKF